jgi:arginyl-tRNA synthetase
MKIENSIKDILKKALKDLGVTDDVNIELNPPSKPEFGDFATNIAMVLAKSLKKSPLIIAEDIKKSLASHPDLFLSVEVAKPGFINLKIHPKIWVEELLPIYERKENFGESDEFKSKKALVEFVSANPTGPLHVGHGRGAVVGDTIARLLKKVGYQVDKEYYVNDGGIQIQTLGRSVYLRYLELKGEKIDFPEDGYQGEYIKDLAKDLLKDKEKYQDESEDKLIQTFGQIAATIILDQIKDELRALDIEFDLTFYESSLYKTNQVDQVIKELADKDLSYEKEEALWLKSTEFGDDKDRVLKKKDGEFTYLTPDIAYHLNKFNRNYDFLVNVWGGDHAGYGARLKAALKGLERDVDKINLVFIQMVSLIKDGEPLSMSTRKAQGEDLINVVGDVGKDATRYFFLMRSYQSQLEFDVDLAKKQSSDNPVYYIQYAHARICSILSKAKDLNIGNGDWPEYQEEFKNHLNLPEEIQLIQKIISFPDFLKRAASDLAPHRLTVFALELARGFQSYYDKARSDQSYRVIQEDNPQLTLAKLFLIASIRQVIQNSLYILGVSAPKKM